ncbi:hypothetical protein K3495_g8762 [Podosphaera aphanis]|nr:hypothetical protein K3495_g8762 [Podosphaera aphanis]
MSVQACAERFLQCFYRFHGFPRAITSDRCNNWVEDFWRRLYDRPGIKQRRSTVFHPETDRAIERANQEVQAYLRAFVTYSQKDWSDLLPAAQLAINNRDSSLGYSPFFLNHGYHVSPINMAITEIENELTGPKSTKARQADVFVRKIEEGHNLAQLAMVWRQQIMGQTANRSRQQAELFQEGDFVWLNLNNKFVKVISTHTVELDVTTGIHPRFRVDLLRRAAEDPLPSQVRDDFQPPPIDSSLPQAEQEFAIERVLRAEKRRRGKGFQRRLLIKWQGQAETTWEPRSELEDTSASDIFEQSYGTEDDVGESITGMHTGK